MPDLQAHSPAMGQEDGEKWTAAVDLQPATPKPDSLLEYSYRVQLMETEMAQDSPQTVAAIGDDDDSQETREWMDALSAVIAANGPQRAHYLLEQLLEHARQNSIDTPF